MQLNPCLAEIKLLYSFYLNHYNNYYNDLDKVNQSLINKFCVVEHDTSENSTGEEIQISYPNGFKRYNCVPIGISGYHKNNRVWYTYLNSNNIQVILGDIIVAIVNSDIYVGNGAKIRIVLMKI